MVKAQCAWRTVVRCGAVEVDEEIVGLWNIPTSTCRGASRSVSAPGQLPLTHWWKQRRGKRGNLFARAAEAPCAGGAASDRFSRFSPLLSGWDAAVSSGPVDHEGSGAFGVKPPPSPTCLTRRRARAWNGCKWSWSPGALPCCCWTVAPTSCTSRPTSRAPWTWPSRGSCSAGSGRATSPSGPSSPATRTRRSSCGGARRTRWCCTTRAHWAGRTAARRRPCWGCCSRSCGRRDARRSIWKVNGVNVALTRWNYVVVRWCACRWVVSVKKFTL